MKPLMSSTQPTLLSSASRTLLPSLTCPHLLQGHPLYVSELLCSYKFNWVSSAACKLKKPPGGSQIGLSPGSILCIIFFASLFLYLVIGSAYNYRAKEARGVEMVPNIDFWRGLPSLIKDGFTFTKDKITSVTTRS